MKLRSLILVALVGGLFFGHMGKSYAITTCNVCADGAHPCTFKCYTGPYDFPFVTTCGQAGYQCFRFPHALSDQQCDLPASTTTISALTKLATDWLQEGFAFVNAVYRVAMLDPTSASSTRS
jgi:hypothetical protein